MSISLSALNYLCELKKNHPIKGEVLTLGKQMVFFDYDTLTKVLIEKNIQNIGTKKNFNFSQDFEHLKYVEPYSRYCNDKAVFSSIFGVFPKVMDITDEPYVDFKQDLNYKIDSGYAQKFSLILDAGTLEHIFDVFTALNNIDAMLKEEGFVVHITPAHGFLDHGYYQISPQLYYDFYSSRGYQIQHCYLAEMSVRKTNHTQQTFWHWDKNILRKKLISDKMLMVYFCAKKTSNKNNNTEKPTQVFNDQIISSDINNESIPWGLEKVTNLQPLKL
ncbi:MULTISPECIES: hypothetical protein [Serratia]|uniref:hypothetical protein n=1 Tax=Serratia TaxID=613 RepID=UPI000AD40B70|nr:hypothetical protein [Serratia sp. 506_PEND]